MPLQQTSGNATTDAYGGGVAAIPNYIEDVFSTWLYTGNGYLSSNTQSINNAIDLAGKGGLVWIKDRTTTYNHALFDTARGTNKRLLSNSNVAQQTDTDTLTAFNSNGFTVGADLNGAGVNISGDPEVSWTFRKQPKFFDVVTYTGNGTNRTIPHNLGSVPGCIIVKRTDGSQNWQVYHNGLTGPDYTIVLNSTSAQQLSTTVWNSTAPTSTVFSVGTNVSVNSNGATYVAYLFAHNAGGFGLTGTDNVISCGSFTTSSFTATVNLGYEPQWLLAKRTDSTGNWLMYDTMRGWINSSSSYGQLLLANTSGAETNNARGEPNATGFRFEDTIAAGTYIYIAIRRGPMKTPTSGTSVFAPVTASSDGTWVNLGLPPDFVLEAQRSGNTYNTMASSRLTGIAGMATSRTDAEGNFLASSPYPWSNQNSFTTSTYGAVSVVFEAFRRAPGFFDEVCYTGDGGTQSLAHNLGVAPELMIVKQRSGATNWPVYNASQGYTKYGVLDLTQAFATGGAGYWVSTPTSTQFTVSDSAYADSWVNGSGATYVAYLFASCPGVSKVGSYTGNGSTQTINCGFTGGARFVLIKRTDSTGSWYVYDTARGMTTLTDPYLLLNSTAAESATLGSVTTVSSGFAVNASILAAINTNAASYIFLAIA